MKRGEKTFLRYSFKKFNIEIDIHIYERRAFAECREEFLVYAKIYYVRRTQFAREPFRPKEFIFRLVHARDLLSHNHDH